MAEQKCPMCGKLNPPELDVCQFCQARLKPLIIGQSNESQPPASRQPAEPASKEGGTPDWLKSLRDRQDDSGGESEEEGLPSWPTHEADERPGLPTGDESVAPNWLDRLRDPVESEEEDFMEAGHEDAADEDEDEEEWVPPGLNTGEESPAQDWLSGIRTTPESSGQEAELSEQDAAGESPDWLDRIRARQQAEIAPEDLQPEQPQDLPDWLRSDDLSTADSMANWPASIRDRSEEAPVDWEQRQSAPKEEEEGLPDWLSDAKEEQADENAPDELPSWLKTAEDVPANVADGTPDWLAGDDEAISPADEFPDWLATGESQPEEQEAQVRPTDWLASTAQEADGDTGADIDWLSQAQEPEPAEDVPDWLRSAGEDAVEPETVISEPDQAAPKPGDELEETVPDWLQPEQETKSGPEGEIPDWLSDISDEEETPEEMPALDASEDLPDWLAGLDHEVEADVAGASTAGTADGESVEAAEPADGLPEWLAGAGLASASMADEVPAELPNTAIIPFDSTEEDEGLAALTDEAAFAEEVPDWLADVKASEEGLELPGERPTGAKTSELAPAELPSWLEAMRPVEAEAAPEILDDRDSQVVSAGPLAGLRGVLPAEAEISKVQRPPVYSNKLQVSDMQQERAAMLEELVQAEGESRPIPGRPLVSSQNLLRMAFALILFVAILWPLVASAPVAPIPVFSPETGAANQLIGQLNSQAPVLVAVDYQPGLSGEMDAIATTLFDHLMLRGAYLTLVSTTASGPIQAEHVVALSNQQYGHSYLGASEYTNLGYIPGGPTGLISFASNPRAMMAYALDDGRPAWDGLPLQNVQSLSDFALLVVLTENPETARAWIEQVQPELGGTPLILGISAQAEPMVRPYYEGFPKQVQGMVVGLAGSVGYESLMGHPGLAHGYWNSFGVGLLAAIILIFFGGVINMVPVFLKSGRDNTAEREGSR